MHSEEIQKNTGFFESKIFWSRHRIKAKRRN